MAFLVIEVEGESKRKRVLKMSLVETSSGISDQRFLWLQQSKFFGRLKERISAKHIPDVSL